MVDDESRMLAVWIAAGSLRVRRDLPVPQPTAGEALVRVCRAGICGTDLQLLRGYADFRGTPGHEFVGQVVGGPEAWLGRRVVAEINVGCGHCPDCRGGHARHCAQRRVLGLRGLEGAFATYLCVPTANLLEVPASLDDDAAVFAEPLAAACRVVAQLTDLAGARAVVVGAGRLGQLVARVLALQPCSVTAATGSERKRRLLPPGIAAVAPASLERRAFDVAIDCTGHPDGPGVAAGALRPRGTLVLKSTHGGMSRLDLNEVVVNELHLIGSRCGPLPEALQLLADGAVDPRPLIDATLPLAEAGAAMAAAAAPGALKVLLAP